MSLEYETVSLGEHLYIKGRIGWKGLKKDEYLDNGNYRIINATALEEDEINWDDCGYITKERFDESPEIILKEKDILISKDGTIGKLGYVKELYMPSTVASGVFVVRNLNNEYIDTDFLYYYFKSPFFKWFIKSVTEGSVIPHLYQRDFTDMEFNLFDLDVQKKCSTILNAIEEKININKRINRNLTELSHVLHKEFIKSIDNNGFCYYKEVKELGTIIMGQSPKGESYNYDNIGLPLINGAADYENGYLKAQKYTTDPKKTCDKNDLIFCIRATIGLLVICDKEYCLGRGVAGITNIDTLYKEYAFHLINSSIENFKRTATGSVISGISRKDIEEIPVRILTKDDMKKYHTIQKPIFDKLENNRIEIDNLIKLRDTLLPRLMSGEIDVSKINCDMQEISTNNWDNKFTVPLQNNLIKVIS